MNKPKPRKTRPNGAAREDILEAAAKLFADKGYDGVTLREIAAKAKVHLPAIYHHFEDKRMLYVACCVAASGRSTAEVASVLREDATDEENIFAFVTEMVKVNVTQPVMTKLAQRQVLDNDKMLLDLLGGTAGRVYYGTIVQILERLVGKTKAIPVGFAIVSLAFGAVQMKGYQKNLFGGHSVGLTNISSIADFVLKITMPEIDWEAVKKRRKKASVLETA